MADPKLDSFSLSVIERQWVHVSVKNQIAMLTRSRNKEMVGSDIWKLRGAELEALTALSVKFG